MISFRRAICLFSLLSAITFIQMLPYMLPPAEAQIGLDDPKRISLYNEITARLACLCGCGATVKGCPHRKCGFAGPLKKDLIKMLKDDVPKEEIMSIFIKKHGLRLLAAPPKTGWYLVGYWLPVTLMIIVGFFIKVVLSKWVSASKMSQSELNAEGELSSEDVAYAEKLKKEMEDFDT